MAEAGDTNAVIQGPSAAGSSSAVDAILRGKGKGAGVLVRLLEKNGALADHDRIQKAKFLFIGGVTQAAVNGIWLAVLLRRRSRRLGT